MSRHRFEELVAHIRSQDQLCQPRERVKWKGFFMPSTSTDTALLTLPNIYERMSLFLVGMGMAEIGAILDFLTTLSWAANPRAGVK